MRNGRQLSKAERQRLIVSVVERRRVGTQQELLEALEQAGVTVTQATVSRDIRELGLEKEVDPVGRLRYVPAGRARRRDDPDRALATLLAQFARRAVPAQNLVVLQSDLGSAPAIARALDRLAHADVVGTLAGDDTVIVVTPDARRARALAAELQRRIR